MYRAHTQDFAEAVHLVEQVYPAHQLRHQGRSGFIDCSLHVTGPKTWPVVRLRYGAAVRVDTDLQHLMVIKRCDEGTGSVRQQGRRACWQPGAIVPISGSRDTQFDFGPGFATRSVKLSQERLELLCSRWLGHPLDVDLQFVLAPFSETLRHTWNSTLALIEASGVGANALPPAAEAALEEFVLTLLLKGHAHNYSEELARPDEQPGSRLVNRAVQFIEENASRTLTASEIAAACGSSVRALQSGFRKWRQMTPTEYLRGVRLQRVRNALLHPDSDTTVTNVALLHGFFHLGHFSQHYKTAFRETPTATLLRARRRAPGWQKTQPGPSAS